MEDIIVIVGPTGVGKTKCSVELAKKWNAEIINGDSVSIYKELNIGSAKPSIEEREGIPNHLMDIKEVDDDYTVFDYQRDCRQIIEEITSRGKRVIIVGGTGLYIKAALYNYQFTEGTTYKEYEELTNLEILEQIKKYKVELLPEVQNRKRLVRLLNKLENKEEITYEKDECLYPIHVIGLTCDRDLLYERINKRVENMMENGLLEEVESLKEKYPISRILKSGIGYKEFMDYFEKKKTLEEVVEEIKQNSRRYAKRQYTFFKHQFDTHWYEVDFENFQNTIDQIETDIKKRA
ncbi:MAG: tRNA (adenosine(37)-N6)-dimethylallyltransferase MiaA [Bacilli bacterium]|nr:tRNA (adenosine(37)-N6)-dimethylallyltransferase MiaA [Bacilli bacterium]